MAMNVNDALSTLTYVISKTMDRAIQNKDLIYSILSGDPSGLYYGLYDITKYIDQLSGTNLEYIISAQTSALFLEKADLSSLNIVLNDIQILSSILSECVLSSQNTLNKYNFLQNCYIGLDLKIKNLSSTVSSNINDISYLNGKIDTEVFNTLISGKEYTNEISGILNEKINTKVDKIDSKSLIFDSEIQKLSKYPQYLNIVNNIQSSLTSGKNYTNTVSGNLVNLISSTSGQTLNSGKNYTDTLANNITISSLTPSGDFSGIYQLYINGNPVGQKINIVQDQFLSGVSYHTSAQEDAPASIQVPYLKFVWKLTRGSKGLSITYVPVNDLVNIYGPGNGISLDNSNNFSIKLYDSESRYVSLSENGLKINGIENSISSYINSTEIRISDNVNNKLSGYDLKLESFAKLSDVLSAQNEITGKFNLDIEKTKTELNNLIYTQKGNINSTISSTSGLLLNTINTTSSTINSTINSTSGQLLNTINITSSTINSTINSTSGQLLSKINNLSNQVENKYISSINYSKDILTSAGTYATYQDNLLSGIFDGKLLGIDNKINSNDLFLSGKIDENTSNISSNDIDISFLSGKIDNKVEKQDNKSLILDTEIGKLSNYPLYSSLSTTIDNKVDKVEGKSLILDTEISRLSLVSSYIDTELRNAISGKLDNLGGTISGNTIIDGTLLNGNLNCLIDGDYAHAEGNNTKAYGNYSHTEGDQTQANSRYSHAEGQDTHAYATGSHTEGYGTETGEDADGSHAEGLHTKAIGLYQHVEGKYNDPNETDIMQIGCGSKDDRKNAFIIDLSGDTKIYNDLYVKGIKIDPNKLYDYLPLSGGTVNGTAIIISSLINGNNSCAVIGSYSHAEGFTTSGKGDYSHAEGHLTSTSGQGSHAEGKKNETIGNFSHAEGLNTKTFGQGSHSEGQGTTASGNYQHVEGRYNDPNTTDIMQIGCGNSLIRKNAFAINNIGDTYIYKNLYISGSVFGLNDYVPLSDYQSLSTSYSNLSGKYNNLISLLSSKFEEISSNISDYQL